MKGSMDFYTINTREKGGTIEVYPDYIVGSIKDLMIRGNSFYAVYDKATGLWSMDKIAIQQAIDADIKEAVQKIEQQEAMRDKPKNVVGKMTGSFGNSHWATFDRYIRSMPDNVKVLDQKVVYNDHIPSRNDYVSKKLPYCLEAGDYSAWDQIMTTLYDPEEREKIEWAIGAILSGDAKKIQKFLVFYGPQGSGKSTVLNIVMKLLDGYYATFKAENLVHANDQFGLKFLSSNPLVAIDEDTNLSKIETNATINKIASHEELEVNEKYKAQYVIKPACMMMLGTNKPVRITDAKSGIIRRMIDVEPSGRKITPEKKYDALNEQVNFELGAIAYHCLEVYNSPERGKHYYSDYVPERMMYRTDSFFNFMQEKQEIFLENDGITANDLWAMWKDYCQQSGIDFTRKRFEIIDEAKNYFKEYSKDPVRIDGVLVRSWFSGLKVEKFNQNENRKSKLAKRLNAIAEEAKNVSDKKTVEKETVKKETKETSVLKEPESKKESDVSKNPSNQVNSVKKVNEENFICGWLKLDCGKSLLDTELADYPAQYETNDSEHPLKYTWKNVKTKLKDLDTSKTHYVKGPDKLIFIDFDKHGKDGKKDLQANLKSASKWKPTYAELSNSGGGLHLLYWYDGDVNSLSSIYDDEIEIKVFPEDQLRSMRRRVSRCNDLPIAHISSGLPFKEKKVINWEGVKDDRHLRNIILQALKKECRPYGEEPKTITCVKYIRDILKSAQDNGMSYDVRDLGEAIYAFAAHSHNNKDECIDLFYGMELMWPKEETAPIGNILDDIHPDEAPVIILDCEVVKNLTLVVYKELEPDGVAGILKKDGPERKCVRLFNPKPHEIENLINNTKIVGHNVTGYDNFILYAKWLGYTPEQVFQVSQDIIQNGNRMPWREAKNISYTDTLDVSSEKKGLKKIEIEMHIPHKEMEIDWSKELPEKEWDRLAQYCENDVLATEAYYLSKKWQADFKARKILSALTGLSVNDSTNNQSAQLIFGDIREPWHEFVYPNLKKEFPEYRFEYGKSYYGDELIGEGGRVYAEQGMYYDVVTFDVASMHPTSIIVENGFGPYTQRYKDLYEARIAIKHKDYAKARTLFEGRLAPYLTSDDDAEDLSYALKIVLNSVYGMTAAGFQNRFRDPRNKDNWVAKRGALFMEKLRREVQARGGHVIHIKTDSIKLVEPSKALQDFVIKFGKEYGYTFEIESKYERICLVNHAVYIALRQKDDPGWLKECSKAKAKAEKAGTEYIEPTRWTATGAQFAHPFVFKRLFSHEPMEFWDFCETKTVKTALYLDMNEDLPSVEQEEKDKKKLQTKIKKLEKEILLKDTTSTPLSDIEKEQIQNEIEDYKKDIAVLDEDILKGHNYVFIGKAGEFVPVKPGLGGGRLMRKESTDGEYGYAVGSKGYRWLESEYVHDFENWKEYIDIRYFKGLVDDAIKTISTFGDFEMFVRDCGGVILPEDRILDYNTDPWTHPCGDMSYAYCSDCPDFENDDQGYRCKKNYDITNQILGE